MGDGEGVSGPGGGVMVGFASLYPPYGEFTLVMQLGECTPVRQCGEFTLVRQLGEFIPVRKCGECTPVRQCDEFIPVRQ